MTFSTWAKISVHALSTICSIESWLASRMIVCGSTVGSIAPVSTSPERNSGAWADRYAGQTILSCAGKRRERVESGRGEGGGVPSTLADPALLSRWLARGEVLYRAGGVCLLSSEFPLDPTQLSVSATQVSDAGKNGGATVLAQVTDLLCAARRKKAVSGQLAM